MSGLSTDLLGPKGLAVQFNYSFHNLKKKPLLFLHFSLSTTAITLHRDTPQLKWKLLFESVVFALLLLYWWTVLNKNNISHWVLEVELRNSQQYV